MFEWRVENQKLRKCLAPNKRFTVEDELTVEEKRKAISDFTNGESEYFILLNEKYVADMELGVIRCNAYGIAKDNSKYAWFRRNDTKHKFWNERYGSSACSCVNDFFSADCIPGVFWEWGDTIDKERINDAFHKLCLYLLEKEKKYFEKHDEYSILKRQFVDSPCQEQFGVNVASDSDGDVYIWDGDRKRPITMEELKVLLEAREEIAKHIEALAEKISIVY